MKRSCLIIASVIALLVSPRTVLALDQSDLGVDRIEYIRNNCGDTQVAISSVRATDKVAYVNIGQQLETLYNRLMAPMNGRVALNKFDGVALAKTTVDFNAEVKRFQSIYREYEQSVARITQMSCYNQPVEFYDNLTVLLQKRSAVRESLDKLVALASRYRDDVSIVQKQVATEGQSYEQ